MKAITTRISGRKFTKRLALIGILAAAPTLTMAASDPDCSRRTERNNPDCGTHNMMIVGEETIFLSHLPMFSSEHRFQVILEATFKKGGNSVDKIYFQDRKGHQQTKMYTLMPSDVFVVSRLFLGNTDSRRNSFAANIYRGHLERGGELIPSLNETRLDTTQIEIRRVVYAAELPTEPGRPND